MTLPKRIVITGLPAELREASGIPRSRLCLLSNHHGCPTSRLDLQQLIPPKSSVESVQPLYRESLCGEAGLIFAVLRDDVL